MSDNNKYKYAYIAVVPDPVNAALGYGRPKAEGQLEFVYWIKVGDTARAQPEQQTKDYDINPNHCSIIPIRFSDPVDRIREASNKHMPRPSGQILQPGKVLENMYLNGYESGGLGQARSSEWHAICVQDIDGAKRLREKLLELLDTLKLGQEYTFDTVSEALKKLVESFPLALVQQADPAKSSQKLRFEIYT